MKILVTGGSGFLGSRLLPALLEEGHKIYALARSASSRAEVQELGAQPIEGDLSRSTPLILPPLDAVIHAAAVFRFSGPCSQFFRANVEGTAKLLAAAEKAGVADFVYISAAGIIMDESGSPIQQADEGANTYGQHFSAYLASKAQAEEMVLSANKPGFRTIALRPPALWGPGDPFSRALPHAIKSGQFVFIDHGDYAFSTCHVDNAVEAVQCALARGEGGRAYFITDQHTLTFRQFIASLASIQGLSIEKLRSMPYWLVSAAGRIMDVVWAILRKDSDPPLSRSMVRMIGREFSVSDDAARRELGYVGMTSLDDGLHSYKPGHPRGSR